MIFKYSKYVLKWRQQLKKIMRVNCKLDERTTRVLIISKLKGHVCNCFHSKTELSTVSIEDTLTDMGKIFDRRAYKMTFRKEFEAGTWKSIDNVMEYYRDKVIMANKVPITEDELIDYLIDEVSSIKLQNLLRYL